MPVNERFPLAEVIDACRAFYARRRRRVFVEYVMLAGINDRYEQALALARLLSPRGGDSTALGARGSRARARAGAGAGVGDDGNDKRGAIGRTSIFKVNLIPFNPTEPDAAPGSERFRCSSRDSIAAFRAVLEAHAIPTTLRLTRGRDIDAACGQLAARQRAPREAVGAPA